MSAQTKQALLDLRVMAIEMTKAKTPIRPETFHAYAAEIKRLCDVIDAAQAQERLLNG